MSDFHHRPPKKSWSYGPLLSTAFHYTNTCYMMFIKLRNEEWHNLQLLGDRFNCLLFANRQRHAAPQTCFFFPNTQLQVALFVLVGRIGLRKVSRLSSYVHSAEETLRTGKHCKNNEGKNNGEAMIWSSEWLVLEWSCFSALWDFVQKKKVKLTLQQLQVE